MKKTLKRSISFVLAFMIVFSMLTVLPSELFHSTYVHAAEAIAELAGADPEIYENDDFTYTLTDEYTKVRIMSCKLDSDEIVIPDTIDGKKVTSIGPNAFQGSSITSVIMGKNIETICEYAFAYCDLLLNVDFVQSKIKTIGERAFVRSSITELVFPDSLESIGYHAFSPYGYSTWGDYHESQLQKVTFGSNLKTIGDNAFYNCDKLSEINFTGDK
ncbi:MAG: leucine-rich repeat domain-containing protein, partial [Ruminococcus sp.]|nr:leucine-rich repeat domain-containing protein [Ruminococcus sp.]